MFLTWTGWIHQDGDCPGNLTDTLYVLQTIKLVVMTVDGPAEVTAVNESLDFDEL